ncbi:glycoside hydrolase family 3 C-terminal domain-containing protein [Isoptericola sp. NPDC057391]|uniref:glycoside hydrolase family 3 C-terminal domain-containing protein n=1 Tax=Isoptericola sp. NPDC057391 TaxID=3346117 RepID=UPI003637EABC
MTLHADDDLRSGAPVPPAPYLDPHLPSHDRAADLLSRLTRTERVAMLHQAAPAVDRLGLTAFRTGTEGLHGVAWLGTATVFPQPVGLAATWDPELLRRVGDAVATEVRAKHAADASVSLNVWAPVVNPLRHPAWGRTEEGFSEDPHLTAQLGAAYAAGLRGDHPRVWKTVPTLKHFLAYGSETDRAVTSASLSLRTLHELELPAFRAAIESGAAGAVMPSYNLVNGRPNHVARELVDELRSWAPASVAVVSDAGAPTNLVVGERYFPDHVTSHAAALLAGVDSFTDNDADAGPTTRRLTEALDRGLLTDADVDRAVLRLLELRIRTGELDGAADPYAGIGSDAIDVAEHRALARETAARSVVVLANDGLLPLAAPHRVAVLGPLGDRVLTDWYSGTPPYAVGLASALAERYPGALVDAVTGADTVALRALSNGAYVTVSPDGGAVTATAPHADDATHLEVTDWGDGVLTLRSAASGRLLTGAGWMLRADADRVGGWVAQETFRRHHHADGSWSLQHVGSGRWVRVQHGAASLVAEAHRAEDAERFAWRTVRSGLVDAVTAARAADVVLVVAGNDPHVAGRETEDRPHLRLPTATTELWRAARESCDRAALVVVSSYPYVLGPETADADAVVWSSHGGQELGHGLVDVLAGDVEPSGRLAQGWPATEQQPGDLLDHDQAAQGATYRYAAQDAAFPFGHGLSYTTVAYERLVLDRATVPAPAPTHAHPALGAPHAAAGAVTARVTVRNTGARPVDELVQLYALPGDLPIPGPRRLLLGHARAALAPGEAAEVELSFDVARLAVWDVAARVPGAPDDWVHAGALRVQAGEYVVAAGPSSAVHALREPLVVTGAAPAPRPVAGTALPGVAASATEGIVLGDRTPEAGAVLEVAPGRARGHAFYGDLDLTGVRAVTLELATTGSVHGGVVLAVPDGAGWRPVAQLLVPSRTPDGDGSGTRAARYRWQPVAGELGALPTGPTSLRVTLPAGARLSQLTFTAGDRGDR